MCAVKALAGERLRVMVRRPSFSSVCTIFEVDTIFLVWIKFVKVAEWDGMKRLSVPPGGGIN
jgi:hypothetical protein